LRVNIIGPLPPPIGGIAGHVESLSRRLRGVGHECRVYDYSNAGSGLTLGAPRLAWDLMRCVVEARESGTVTHVHLSAARRFVMIAPVLELIGAVGPLVATVHSGSFGANVLGLSKNSRVLLSRAFRRMSAVIAVSEAVQRTLVDELNVPQSLTSVCSPYLGGGVSRPVVQKAAASVCASGYGIPLYGWMDLVHALKRSSIERADLVFYGTIDSEYLAEVTQAVSDDSRFRMHFSLPRADFVELLDETAVFVRPTLTDGDSVAVREALASGCSVVASDVVVRPPECILYASGDLESLGRAIAAALAASSATSTSRVGPNDDFDEILEQYALAQQRFGLRQA
jgi:glycosyltransferase involved in cell wall biosynthesis